MKPCSVSHCPSHRAGHCTGTPIKPIEKGLPKWVESLCPECRKVTPAKMFEEDGAVWMEKTCPEHGYVKDLYWSDAELYLRAEEWFLRNVTPSSSVGALANGKPRPFSPQYLPRVHELGYATYPVVALPETFEQPQPEYLILSGYLIVVIITGFAPPEIVGIAYDSGGVTTSTMTVPLVAALGVGLATVIRGRNPLLDGFGLIAFASLTVGTSFPFMALFALVSALANLRGWICVHCFPSLQEDFYLFPP